MLLVDTDILIWYMKGNEKAFRLIENNKNFQISVVTYIEIVQGMRNKEELKSFRKFLKSCNTQFIYINEEISTKAMFYVEQYYLSHSIQLADALMAATAVSHGLPITTGNYKHYKVIKEIQINKFRP